MKAFLSESVCSFYLAIMEIHPIENERDYQEALKCVSALVDADPAPGTPDGVQLQRLATLIEQYEAEHVPLDPGLRITPPDPDGLTYQERLRSEGDGREGVQPGLLYGPSGDDA